MAQKLGIATGCMFTVPVIMYYVGEQYLFASQKNPSNWAAGLAILATNIIVGTYVYVAFQEDDEIIDKNDKNNTRSASQQDENDDKVPRVGIYKQRTD